MPYHAMPCRAVVSGHADGARAVVGGAHGWVGGGTWWVYIYISSYILRLNWIPFAF